LIAIVNYGSGNIQAIANIYGRLSVPFVVAATPGDLVGVDRIILPGVGAFDQAMNELDASGIRQALDVCVLNERKPILGICVGMQLLAKSSEEGGAKGLGWLDATVKRFEHSTFGLTRQLPHLGWNTVNPARADALFAGVEAQHGYYFLHSYYFSCHDPDDVLASTDYGGQFTCAVRRQNVYGVQFHPEKSHQNGVQLLKNFALL
jgi:imidazole glycerol-phosphate synthase subunit HisH